jgi:hypothetical protein
MPHRAGSTSAATSGGAPTDREGLASAANCPTWDTAASSFSRLSRTTPSSSLPELVRPTWRVVRSNRRNPNWVSNSRIKTPNPEGVMYSAVLPRRHKRETSKPAGHIPLLRTPQQVLKYLNLYHKTAWTEMLQRQSFGRQQARPGPMNHLGYISPVSNLLNSFLYPNFASGIKVVAARYRRNR